MMEVADRRQTKPEDYGVQLDHQCLLQAHLDEMVINKEILVTVTAVLITSTVVNRYLYITS